MSILLTGATGFVGMEVLARLLDRGEHVTCAIRGDDPDARLAAALDTIGVPEAQRGAAVALRGDVTTALPDVPGVATVVHCAASVSFALPLDEAHRINVDGTRHALDAARRAGARYVHVSTAYVAGRHSGRFHERQLMCGQTFRNTYEQSKAEAELLVHRSGADAVVVRPSIVMGESTTGWTPAFNVLYWPLRAFDRGLLASIPSPPAARVDIVPVDYVADAVCHVSTERRDVQGVLHLVAGDAAPTVEQLVDLAAGALDRECPRLVGPAGALAERSSEAARYLPYFDMDIVFDDVRSRRVLRPAGIAPPPLADYFGRLVDFARRARWGKRPLSRPDADFSSLTPSIAESRRNLR